MKYVIVLSSLCWQPQSLVVISALTDDTCPSTVYAGGSFVETVPWFCLPDRRGSLSASAASAL